MKDVLHYLVENRLIFWPALIIAWYLWMAGLAIDGYFRQLMGHHHHHARVHYLVWQFYTGMHVHPMRSYGDERRLSRTAISSNRATPEGDIVYFARRRRWQRALIRNAATIASLSAVYGLIFYTQYTIQAITSFLIVGACALIVLMVQKIRKAQALKAPRKIKTVPFARSPVLAGVPPEPALYVSGGQIVAEKPKLDGGVPIPIMAQLLAREIGCSSAETLRLLDVEPDRGKLTLPDHFQALQKQQDVVEEIIASHTSGKVGFTWALTSVPRTVRWVPLITSLPNLVPFRNYLPQLQKLKPGEFGVGVEMQGNVHVVSHNGDTPWFLRSCGSGTGKSTAFKVKLAQICYNNPLAEVYCIDTKQVSFAGMHGIPGVHIYDDPVEGMDAIYDVWYILWGIMRDRYTALRKGDKRTSDFEDLWILTDEGNDLAAQLKAYYTGYRKESGDPTQPKVWIEAIAPLIYQGREVNIRGEWMFQNMTDRVLGGVSLRDAFPVVGMAGYKKQQWSRIIGTSYVEPKVGPGRICIVEGNNNTWVQGFFDDTRYLRGYALARR